MMKNVLTILCVGCVNKCWDYTQYVAPHCLGDSQCLCNDSEYQNVRNSERQWKKLVASNNRIAGGVPMSILAVYDTAVCNGSAPHSPVLLGRAT